MIVLRLAALIEFMRRLLEGGGEIMQRARGAVQIVKHSVEIAARHVLTGKFPNVGKPEERSCLRCTGPMQPKVVERDIQEEIWRQTCAVCGWIDWDAPIPVVAGLLPFPRRFIGETGIEGEPFDFDAADFEDPSETGVVCIRRKNPPFVGEWALPGGYVMKGHTLVSALADELRQEVGIRALIERFLHPCNPLPGRLNQVIMHGLASPRSGTLLAGDDAAEVGVFGRRNMPELCFSSHQKTATDYFDGKNGRIMLAKQYP